MWRSIVDCFVPRNDGRYTIILSDEGTGESILPKKLNQNTPSVYGGDSLFSEKKKIDAKVGEFWWYYEGINIGNEISKDGSFLRPCIILQNSLGNGLLLIAPITSKYYHWMQKYYVPLDNFEKYGFSKISNVITNQIKCIDTKRLQSIVGSTKASFSLVQYIRGICSRLITKG